MLTVKKIADLLGVSNDLIRHHSESGILTPWVNSQNRYKYYDDTDFLLLAQARNDRSLGFSLSEIKEFQYSDAQEKTSFLDARLSDIESQLQSLERVKKRLKEEAFFLNLSALCNGTVKDVRRSAIHSIYTYSASGTKKINAKLVREWTDLFPFSHVSIKISKEELNNPNFKGPYSVEIGFGLTDEYMREFKLSEEPPVENIPAGRFLIIYLKTRDILSVTSEELKPLTDKSRELGLPFTHQSSGRLLNIEKDGQGLLFSVLIRVRIGD